MYDLRLKVIVLSACLAFRVLAVPSQSASFEVKDYHPTDVVDRDVAIIGGGSSGTYSAISLKDKGKSTIVIEKKGRMGGHCETYIDPATGTPIDIGVLIFHNTTMVKNYFARLKVPVGKPQFEEANVANYDFRTGKEVTVSGPNSTQTADALAAFAKLFDKYPGIADGMFLPNPVPEDLVMPFDDFIKKYKLEGLLSLFYNYNPGEGDILKSPAVEQMRLFVPNLLNTIVNGFLRTAHQNNSELYTSAQNELLADSSLLLNSEVVHAQRNNRNHGIKLVVRTPKGYKLIRAKKLLISIPPRLDFLSPFDLSHQEKHIFSKLVDAGYYTSIVKNTGIPSGLSVSNMRPDTPYNLPELPGVYNIGTTGVPGLHTVYYGSLLSTKTFPLSDEKVKADIIAGVKKLQSENPDKFNKTTPEFMVYSSHAPFYLQARPEDTKKGFYKDMYELQGGRNTWWTGAAWKAQDSSELWRYTEEKVLPGLLEGL